MVSYLAISDRVIFSLGMVHLYFQLNKTLCVLGENAIWNTDEKLYQLLILNTKVSEWIDRVTLLTDWRKNHMADYYKKLLRWKSRNLKMVPFSFGL